MKKINIVLLIVCLLSISFLGCQKKTQSAGDSILGTWIGIDEQMGNVEFTKEMKFRIFDNAGAYDDMAEYAIVDGKLQITFEGQTNTFDYEIKDGTLKIITLPTAQGQASQTLEFKKATNKQIADLKKQIETNKKAAQENQNAQNQQTTGEVTMPKASDDIVVFETTKGTIKIELYPEAAPKTVQNFYNLVNEGFYNGIIFHRVIPDFMIQCGGVSENGNPKNVATPFEDEINPTALGLTQEQIAKNEQEGYKYNYSLPSFKLLYGIVAMANAGPNTNGSQIFIITKKEGTEWLNGRHTGFGKVIEGMDIAEKIQSEQRDQSDKPLTNIVIKKAYVAKR